MKDITQDFSELQIVCLDKVDIVQDSKYNWDSEWYYLIEDKGEEFITYGMYLCGYLEGMMTIAREMNGSLEIYKLEVSAKNRKGSNDRTYRGIGKFLVSYACWLANNIYLEQSKGLVSLYSKKGSKEFYEILGAKLMDDVYDLYFVFPKDKVADLASKVEPMGGLV